MTNKCTTMRKLASFLLAMCSAILCASAGSGTSYTDPIDFDWTAGNDYPGGGTALWYKVDLTSVPQDNDVLLYLNNLSSASPATVTAEPYVKLGTIQSLNEPTTKQILPNRNYAMNLPNSTIKALNVDAIYILLSSDEPVRFSAEPVEQGEKDLNCLNAPLFDFAGVTQAPSEVWYRVNLAAVQADATKTLKITLQNKSSESAQVKAGVSFDCPSSGLSYYQYTLSAAETKEKVLDRAFIDLVSSDEIYVKVNTTQSVFFKAEIVDATVLPATDVPATAIDFALNTEYTNYLEQWYKITVADLLQDKKLAELTLSNTSSSTAHITADVAISNPYTSLITRSISLGSNQLIVKELARNLLKEIENNTYVYVRLTSDQPITFSARLKNRTEGNACRSAKLFDWNLGAMQNAETSLWYAVSLTDAKSAVNADKDIMLTVENLSSSQASLLAAVAFGCPCSATTDINRTVAPMTSINKRIERALYSNLETDTLFVNLTTDKNVRITASLVPSVASVNDCATPATTFDYENGHHQSAGKNWYSIDISPIWAMRDTVPQIVVVNEGTSTATINGELAFECPGNNAATRTMRLAPGEEYVKAITRDLLESLSNPELYISVDTDQPLHIYVNLQKENQGLSCLTGVDFDWNNGHIQKASSTVWYKIGLTHIKQTPSLAAVLGIVNKNAQAGKVTADIYFDCNSDPVASYAMTLSANGKREINLERSTILSLKPDTIYLCLTTEQQDSVYAATFADGSITPVEACNGATELLYNTDIPQSAGEQWYKFSVYHLQNFTSGDATLYINNGADANTIKAEVAFECPVTTPMTDRTKEFTPLQAYSKVFSRALLDNISGDSVYVRVTSSKDFAFRIDISDERGQVCSAPILFDWDNGNLHPADKTLWYKVSLDTLRKNPDKDFKLNVENRASNNISASADIHFDCDDEPLVSFSYDFTPNELKSKIIDRTFMEQMGWPIMLIKFSSTDGDAHISAELIDALPDKRDTLIVDTVTCKGNTEFEIIQTHALHTIISDTTIVDSLRYTYNDGILTMQGDSIFIYHIRVLHTPPAQYPVEFMAMPVTAGKAIDITAAQTAVLNALNNYNGSAPDPVSGLDSLYSAVESIVWQQQLVEGGPFVPLNTTSLLDTRTQTVTLRYRYQTECQGGNTSTALQIPAAEPLRETLVIQDVVDAGDTYITLHGQSVVINADTTFSDTIFNLVHDAQTLKDSVYLYQIFVYSLVEKTILDTVCLGDTYTPVVGEPQTINRDTVWSVVESVPAEKNKYRYTYRIRVLHTAPAQYPAAFTAMPITAGKAIDITAAQEALIDALNTYSGSAPDPVSGLDSLYSTVTSVSWQQQITEGGPFVPLNTTSLLDTRTQTVTLRYSYQTECHGENTSAAVQIPAAEPLRETLVIQDTVDAGETYITLQGRPVVINADTAFSDTIFNLVHDAQTLKDSVYQYQIFVYSIVETTLSDTVCLGDTYTPAVGEPVLINRDTIWSVIKTEQAEKHKYIYNIYLYTAPEPDQLPDANAFSLPTAVCGQPLNTSAATDAILSLLLAQKEAQTFTADISQITWEMQVGSDWQPVSDLSPVVENMNNISVRYKVLTACNDIITSPQFTLVVEAPTADNVADYADMPAVAKYNGWLLMVNLNAINAQGWNPAEQQVRWYRVVGQLDTPANGETDDEFLATGYYYTKGEQLSGDYYAVIDFPATENDPCGASLRTVTLTCAAQPTQASLAPSVVAPGETIQIIGLDPLQSYTVSVYNLAGVLVENFILDNTEAHSFKAQAMQGYYMVKVQGSTQQTLKYIVK